MTSLLGDDRVSGRNPSLAGWRRERNEDHGLVQGPDRRRASSRWTFPSRLSPSGGRRRRDLSSIMSAQGGTSGAPVAPASQPEAINAQLERILNSAPFTQADQLRRFLAFIVGELVEGRGPALKEHVIAVRVLRKDATFDPRTDPIVRVQARRLRTKLERYYHDEGANDPLIIELPRGGYAPVIHARKAAGEV